MNSRTARRLMVGAAVLGFVARAGFGLIYWHDKPLTHDERQYLSLAGNLAAGRGFVEQLPGEPRDNAQQFGRAPLYPLFLAPLTLTNEDLRAGHLPADVPIAVKLAQALVGAIGVWLIGELARRPAGDRAGVAAATIAAVYPPLVWICAYALSEALYSTLALACVAMLASVLDDDGKVKTLSPPAPSPPRRLAIFWGRGGITKKGPESGPFIQTRSETSRQSIATSASGVSTTAMAQLPAAQTAPIAQLPAGWQRVLIGGVFAGLAILTRPAMMFFLPFELWLAWKRRAALAGWLLLGAVAVVLPWTLRNAVVYQRLVVVASEGGVTFWTGNHPEARGEGDLAANPRLAELNREFRVRHGNLTEEELESIYYREALGFIASDPIGWIGLMGRKLFYTVVPIGPSYRLHSPRYFWMSVAAYGLVVPFAAAGALRLWRLGRRPWSLWWLTASAVFVCLAFFPQERFRIPVIDPALIVCAAALTSTASRPAGPETT